MCNPKPRQTSKYNKKEADSIEKRTKLEVISRGEEVERQYSRRIKMCKPLQNKLQRYNVQHGKYSEYFILTMKHI